MADPRQENSACANGGLRVCVIHPGGDGAHPWVREFLSAFAAQSRLQKLDVGLSADQVRSIGRGFPQSSPAMSSVMAERSREASGVRRGNFEAGLAAVPPESKMIQIYSNDSADPDRLDGILTDTLLATVASMAHVLEGYDWDPGLLEDALARELETLRTVPRIWVASHWQRNWCIETLPADISSKISVVGWGPGLAMDSALPVSDRFTRKTILFVGNDQQRKGLDVLLGAFRQVRERHRDAELWVVGEGEAVPADEGVVRYGRLDQSVDAERQALVDKFSRASVAVLPSRFEPFGCFLLEAMSVELPIIAPRAFAFPELLKDGETGLFMDGSASGLAASLDWLFRNPAAARRMGQNGRAFQAAHFGWANVAERILNDLEIEC